MLLASLALLSGCSQTVAVIAVEELCQSWRHQSVSKRDKLTDETASQIEGNNKARPAWGCKPGENTSEGL
jgi:hypothetical protein